MEYDLDDTDNLKVRLEIFMTGTKVAVCHQITADCDDLATCSKLLLPKFCKIIFILQDDYWKGN